MIHREHYLYKIHGNNFFLNLLVAINSSIIHNREDLIRDEKDVNYLFTL